MVVIFKTSLRERPGWKAKPVLPVETGLFWFCIGMKRQMLSLFGELLMPQIRIHHPEFIYWILYCQIYISFSYFPKCHRSPIILRWVRRCPFYPDQGYNCMGLFTRKICKVKCRLIMATICWSLFEIFPRLANYPVIMVICNAICDALPVSRPGLPVKTLSMLYHASFALCKHSGRPSVLRETLAYLQVSALVGSRVKSYGVFCTFKMSIKEVPLVPLLITFVLARKQLCKFSGEVNSGRHFCLMTGALSTIL